MTGGNLPMTEPEPNERVELHDSTLGKIEFEGSELKLQLTPAYIHKSTGEPRVAPGTGWIQDVVLVFRDGELEGETPQLPCKLNGGSFSAGMNLWSNGIPLPLEYTGNVKLELEVMWGGHLTVTGKQIKATSIGEPQYVEEFDGSQGLILNGSRRTGLLLHRRVEGATG